MALKYKLISRKRTIKGEETIIRYAQQTEQTVTPLPMVISLVEKISAISSGDIKSVLDTLSQIVAMELAEGRIVDLGDLGRFRFVARSIAAKEGGAEFTQANLMPPMVRFAPGRAIRLSRAGTTYQLVPEAKSSQCPATPGGTPNPNPNGTGGDPSSTPGN